MTTPLTKPLKRQIEIDGRAFVVTLSPEGIAVTVKGKRKGQELRWKDLINGDAALATALNASLRRLPESGLEKTKPRMPRGRFAVTPRKMHRVK